MRKYHEDMMFSFKLRDKPEREICLQRSYTRRGTERLDTFYGEFTNTHGVIVLPDSVIDWKQDNSPHGYLGVMKPGKYLLNGIELQIGHVTHIYNGVGYAHIDNWDVLW